MPVELQVHHSIAYSVYTIKKAQKRLHGPFNLSLVLSFSMPLPPPPIRFYICKPFPLKSMCWLPLPSHLYYFNSRQVFSIREGTDWHATHCFVALHGVSRRAGLSSLGFVVAVRGTPYTKLEIAGRRPDDQFWPVADGHLEDLDCVSGCSICSVLPLWNASTLAH